MYMDDSIFASLIIIGATCIIVGYMGYFAYRHIKEDIKKHPGE